MCLASYTALLAQLKRIKRKIIWMQQKKDGVWMPRYVSSKWGREKHDWTQALGQICALSNSENKIMLNRWSKKKKQEKKRDTRKPEEAPKSANKTKPLSLVIVLPHQEKTARENNCYLIVIVNKGSTYPTWLALAGVRFNLWLPLAETNIQSERRGWHQGLG